MGPSFRKLDSFQLKITRELLTKKLINVILIYYD